MGHTHITKFVGHLGFKALLQDKDTHEPIGIIFVYQERSRKFARFIQFNNMLSNWFFSELPPAFAEDETLLTDLTTQLTRQDITFLFHPNETPLPTQYLQ